MSKTAGRIWELATIVSKVVKAIGIIRFFSCINICQGLRKLFEPEAARSRVQTAYERHG